MNKDLLRLLHIRDSIAAIESYYVQSSENPMITDAILRHIGIIGEAASRISQVTRSQAPQVPWQEIIGMRQIVVHDYFNINYDIVREVVEVHIPLLKGHVLSLIKQLQSQEG